MKDATLSILVTYDQSGARSMLNLINNDRSINGSNEDAQLPYTYDYNLEKAAILRAAELVVKDDINNHTRPNGESYKTALQEYGYNISPRGYLYGEILLFSDSGNIQTADAAFRSIIGSSGNQSLIRGYYSNVAISHVRISGNDVWVLLFSDAPNKGAETTEAVDGAKYAAVNVPLDGVQLTPEYVSGAETVAVGSTVDAPVYKVNANFSGGLVGNINVSTVERNSGDEFLKFNSTDEYVKAENGQVTGLKAGTGTLSTTFLGKQVSVSMEVTGSSSSSETPTIAPRIQELIAGATDYSIYTVSNVQEDSILKNSADVERFIYDSARSYSSNTLVVSSLELLQPEEYYSDKNPALASLVFSNAVIYKNLSTVKCSYTSAHNSFDDEEDAVEYALVNGTDYLSSSELELYNKVMELASSLKATGDNSEYDTVKNIHDYLVRSIAYTYQEDMNTPNDDRSAQRLSSALFLHKCVCAGYAKSFYFLCKAAGLDVVYVTGNATNSSGTQSHAWNKVKIGGKWYAIDVTWDDPLVYDPNTSTSHDGGDTVEYTYFLITDADMAINHTWDDTGLPVADSDDLAPIYLQYADIPKFTSDDAAYEYILAQLNAYKAQNNPSQSGFDFEITVLSTDGSTLYSKISQLANEYHSTYGCGASRGYSSAGFYGLEFTLQIYK